MSESLRRSYQRALRRDDAVSPVIAVILMVAITVVLAATVYVWVSGFGAQSGSPAKLLSLSSAGVLHTTGNTTGDTSKNYTIASATSGMKYSDLAITLDGATMDCKNDWVGAANNWRVRTAGSYASCASAGPSSVVQAGDTIELYHDGGSLSGKTLRIVHGEANAVILSLVIG